MRSTFKVLFYTKNQLQLQARRIPVLMGCQRKLCQGQVRRGQTAKPGTGQYQGTDQQALPVYL